MPLWARFDLSIDTFALAEWRLMKPVRSGTLGNALRRSPFHCLGQWQGREGSLHHGQRELVIVKCRGTKEGEALSRWQGFPLFGDAGKM